MVFSGPSVVFTVERSAKDWLTEGGGRVCSALVRGGGQPVWRENLGVGGGGGRPAGYRPSYSWLFMKGCYFSI